MCNGRCQRYPAISRLVALVTGLVFAGPGLAQPFAISPATMPRIATVDERYQSYNVEIAEVIGDNFWKPYYQRSKPAQNSREAAAGAPSGGAGLQAGEPEHIRSAASYRSEERASAQADGGPRTGVQGLLSVNQHWHLADSLEQSRGIERFF